MKDYQKAAIIIPSLSPDEKLITLLSDLKKAGFEDLLIVNDGSSAEYDSYFETAKTEYGCVVLTHAVNQGKGRALKTAFNYLLNREKPCPCAVTVDSDGQHQIDDIIRVAQTMLLRPNSLTLGCRDFSGKNPNIPARSRFGNRTTSRALRLLSGVKLSDTQTGLRGFSEETMRYFLSTKGERFEYEMNMILDAHEGGIPFVEVPISTIYIEENKTSHFNPLLDSFRIYAVFAKFILSSLASWVVDIGLFAIINAILALIFGEQVFRIGSVSFTVSVFAATFGARIVSALVNYTLNRKRVFKSGGKFTFIRYALLSVCQVALSAALTSFLHSQLAFNATVLKLLVDIVLFLLSFGIQRNWVFKA